MKRVGAGEVRCGVLFNRLVAPGGATLAVTDGAETMLGVPPRAPIGKP